MTMEFQAKMSFSISDKDKKLYDKYGIPAIELANDGEFLAAVKLIDKILKQNPKCEFALLLKANYLFNHVNQNLQLDEVSPENIKKIHKQTKDFKKQLEECIKLIDKALKINSKNKDAKGLKDFIEKNSLKEVNNLIKTIASTTKSIKAQNREGPISAKLTCPYCGLENFDISVKKTEDVYTCPKCKKSIKAIVGIVRAREGRFRTWGYGQTPYTIRLKTLEGQEKAIFFTSDYKFEVRSGDQIALLYKKGWLSSNYSDKPCGIINWTIGVYFDKI